LATRDSASSISSRVGTGIVMPRSVSWVGRSSFGFLFISLQDYVVKVDPDALAGIDVKIKRANEHLRTLHDQMLVWNADWPYRLIHEVHDNGRKHIYRLKLLKPIPVDWSVILGEAVHDLRSALEQSAYWLTVDWSKKVLPGTGFPVYDKSAEFYQRHRKTGDWTYTSGMNKIRGIGPGPQAFIESLQPYPQRLRFDHCSALRALNDLWNQDKHRLVHLWGMRFADEQATLDDKIDGKPVDCTALIDRRVRHDRAIVLKILCATPHPHVEVVGGGFLAEISLTVGQRKSGVHTSLWDMQRFIVDTVSKLTGAIGKQERPISSRIWSTGPSYPST
jgi:hypothetical protein